MRWLVAIVCSSLIAILLSNLFMDDLYSYEYDKSLQKYVYKEKTVYHKRQEGWASTLIGKHDTYGLDQAGKKHNEKLVIWGDSEVEAFQVPDTAKMAYRATKILNDNGLSRLAFSVAHSGNSFADYYFDIPKYERIIPGIVSHYLILCNLEDALTDKNEGRKRSRFFIKDGKFKLEPSECEPPHVELINLLSRYKLRIISYLVGRTTDFYKSVLTKPSKQVGAKLKEKNVYEYEKKKAWSHILSSIKSKTNLPITIVYCPYVPVIQDKQVLVVDPAAEDKEKFAEICKQTGIKFIDLSDSFVDLYSKKFEFPRGFKNTMPSKGHMNINGHEIVARAIYKNESTL